eukprot:1161801-Pelagomonas_calceolata.AAC.3
MGTEKEKQKEGGKIGNCRGSENTSLGNIEGGGIPKPEGKGKKRRGLYGCHCLHIDVGPKRLELHRQKLLTERHQWRA